jgi:hypothetical protein
VPTVNEALKLVEEIQSTIEEDITDEVFNKASDFFISVKEKAASIGETIEDKQRVSEKQFDALDRMLAGVRKWLAD